ncbi:MAG: hypothetical protein HOW73_27295 [Polyangiaceae bacterium]|nr:hypothetical protein [Polyangiaceae bacterium]
MREIVAIVAWLCTGGLIMSAALRTGTGAWAAFRSRPVLFVRALVAVWVVIPLLAMAIARAFSLTGETRGALILLSISPGIPVLLSAARRRGPSALTDGLVFLALVALTAPLFLPIWAQILKAVYSAQLVAKPLDLAMTLLPTIYIPMALGIVIHKQWPRRARTFAKLLEIAANVGTVFAVILLLRIGFPVLRTLQPALLFAAPLLFLACGYAGWLAAAQHRDDRKLFALAAALGNPALGLALIATTYPTERAAAVAAAILIVRTLCLPVLLVLGATPPRWFYRASRAPVRHRYP